MKDIEFEELKFEEYDYEENRTMAILVAALPFMFFLPLLTGRFNYSLYTKFFVNQGLVLTLSVIAVDLVVGIVCNILAVIPFIGVIVGALVGGAVQLIILAVWGYGIYNACRRKAVAYPLIGKITILE